MRILVVGFTLEAVADSVSAQVEEPARPSAQEPGAGRLRPGRGR
ncbi:hypothetical protein [Streptomyces flaveolus]